MLPIHAANDCADSSLAKAELSAELRLGFAKRVSSTNLAHLVRSQDHRVLSTSLDHIDGVVCCRSKAKVFWVHASRHVTRMEHEQSWRNRAVVKFPRRSVRGLDLVANADDPIARRCRRAGPEPTRWTFLDLRPEATRDRCRRSIPCPFPVDFHALGRSHGPDLSTTFTK